MRTWTKVFVAAVLAGGMMAGAQAQAPVMVTPSMVTLNAGDAQLQLRINPSTIASLTSSATVYISAPFTCLSPQGGLPTYNQGNLRVEGNIVATTKCFIHPHPTDESKVIRYISIESGEALTVARGVARTEGGEAVIELPEHFSMVTSGEVPITVIITPEGAPVLLYTRYKSKDKIVVAMREPDFVEFRDIEFSYHVTGVRDGFEKIETIVNEDNLSTLGSVREDVQERIDALRERTRTRLEKETGVEIGN
jgi:hypothetical protein